MTILRWLKHVLGRAKLALVVFRRGLPIAKSETDKAVAEFISGQRKPGFPCPRCQTPVVVGIAQLIARSDVTCSGCGLELRMNWQDDPKALRALQNIQMAARQVEQARRFRA